MSVDIQPVFVIGFPRSGTTLLLHMLMSSGEFPVYGFSESHFFSHCYRRYGSLTRAANREALLRELEARNWFGGTEVTRQQLVDRVGDRKDHYETYFRSFMELLAESQGKRRWLEKTPWHYKYAREIRREFPEARFLIMVRDPRDVVLSISNYGWIASSTASLLRAAIAWRHAMRQIAREFPEAGDDHLVVKYEAIVTDTARQLELINDFLGLSMSLAKLQSAEFGVVSSSNSSYGSREDRGISKSSVGRYRQAMPERLLGEMNYLLSDQLAAHGYAVDGGRPPSVTARIRLSAMGAAYDAAKGLRRLAFPLVRR